MKGESEGKTTYYEDLLEVIIRNTTYIFDLNDDFETPKEVNFIEGIDQLVDLDTFVNQGTSHTVVVSTKQGQQ